MPELSSKPRAKRYVMVEVRELRRLRRLAAKFEAWNKDIPPAVAFSCASVGRKIQRDRKAAGLSQAELARRAGLGSETICRLETGIHVPNVRTITRIERALQAALKKPAKPVVRKAR